MGVLRETDWLDGAWWKDVPDIGDALFRAVTDPSFEGRCVFCRAEQPHDVKWPAYSFELEHKTTHRVTEYEYRTCPACEPRHDEILDILGAEDRRDE